MPRCLTCNKKVGLLGFQCTGCVRVFCTAHRLAEDHACDRMDVFRDTAALRAANPKVAPAKIAKI